MVDRSAVCPSLDDDEEGSGEGKESGEGKWGGEGEGGGGDGDGYLSAKATLDSSAAALQNATQAVTIGSDPYYWSAISSNPTNPNPNPNPNPDPNPNPKQVCHPFQPQCVQCHGG